MQLFYVSVIQGDACVLSEEESWHCMKVLRSKEGDVVHLTDGQGQMYQGTLSKIHHKGCLVEIIGSTSVLRNPWRLHLAVAPTKNIDRFEWFLEKATEIGVDEITPLFCEHSERDTVKPQRLEKVIISAMKQSLNVWLPILHPPVKFKDFITKEYKGQKFIGYCETGNESALGNAYIPGNDTVVLIGPEGDFSKNEVDLATQSGFLPVSLGSSRLRTETAGIVACHTIGIINTMGTREQGDRVMK
jgi:16S rRNA (uracil1498-N3)-methyltransferase